MKTIIAIIIILVLLILWYVYNPLNTLNEGLDQPNIPTIKTDPVYTVINTSTGALTVPGKIEVPKVPIYAAQNYWQLYLQRGSSTLPGQKHPMYMRGDANSWIVWKNSFRPTNTNKYRGNMQWGS